MSVDLIKPKTLSRWYIEGVSVCGFDNKEVLVETDAIVDVSFNTSFFLIRTITGKYYRLVQPREFKQVISIKNISEG